VTITSKHTTSNEKDKKDKIKRKKKGEEDKVTAK
jgi:hypothetical protein